MEIETVVTSPEGEVVQAVYVNGALVRIEVVGADGLTRSEYEPDELADLAAGKYTTNKPYISAVLTWWHGKQS